MIDKYCSKQDRQHTGFLSPCVHSLLFNNWFNPTMSDKTLIKPLKAQKAQKIKNSVYSVFSVVNNGKWVLPTSCRFKAVRSEKRGVRSFVLLPAYCSQLTAHGAMHQNKVLPNLTYAN